MQKHSPPFLVEYTHRGTRYSTTVGGDSWTEAADHLKSIGTNGRIIGSNVASFRTNAVTLPFVHLFVSAWTWLRNLLR